MKRLFLCLVVLMTIVGNAQAQTLVVSKSGYYLLTQDAAGVPVLTKIQQVITLGEGPGPIPNPTNPTAEAIRLSTAKVVDPNKANVRQALSQLYRTVAGLPVVDRGQLVTSTDLLFNALNLPLWTIWKTEVDGILAVAVSLDDAKRAWVIVADVLGEK